MKTICVSPEFPLNRRMRKDIRRGKLQVIREGGEKLSLGGGMPFETGRAFRTHSSPLVCMADNGAEVRGGASLGNGERDEQEFLVSGSDEEQIKIVEDRIKSGVRTLYKYCCTSTAEKILADGTVLLKPAASFNDPFELMCRVNWPDDDELRRRIDREFALFSDARRNELYQDALHHKREYGRYLPPHTEKLLLHDTGISCFSEKPDNILMWSHYADNHKGVCLGFSIKWLLKSLRLVKPGGILDFAGVKDQCVPLVVQYQDALPVWEAGLSSSINGVLSTKARCWDYEREWRIFAHSAVDKKQNFMGLAFAEVILGGRMSEQDETRLVRSVVNRRDNAYWNVKFMKAKMSRDEYKMEVSDYEWARS